MNFVPPIELELDISTRVENLLGASESFQTAVSLCSAGTGVGTTHLSPVRDSYHIFNIMERNF